jgi:DNA-binding transcriptional regulator LsrR (DeoR family)
MSEDSNIVRMGWFSTREIAQAKMAGTVGDVMGYDFIDIRGTPSALAMQGRVIGLSLPDLKKIPNVIAVASEPTKVSGILGALNAGVIDTLATTASNAMSVLNFAEALQSSNAPEVAVN